MDLVSTPWRDVPVGSIVFTWATGAAKVKTIRPALAGPRPGLIDVTLIPGDQGRPRGMASMASQVTVDTSETVPMFVPNVAEAISLLLKTFGEISIIHNGQEIPLDNREEDPNV